MFQVSQVEQSRVMEGAEKKYSPFRSGVMAYFFQLITVAAVFTWPFVIVFFPQRNAYFRPWKKKKTKAILIPWIANYCWSFDRNISIILTFQRYRENQVFCQINKAISARIVNSKSDYESYTNWVIEKHTNTVVILAWNERMQWHSESNNQKRWDVRIGEHTQCTSK